MKEYNELKQKIISNIEKHLSTRYIDNNFDRDEDIYFEIGNVIEHLDDENLLALASQFPELEKITNNLFINAHDRVYMNLADKIYADISGDIYNILKEYNKI